MTSAKGQPFTFIDLFAGIGGIRVAFEAVGGECVLTAEWNDFAEKTYRAFFPHDDDSHRFIKDINDAFVSGASKDGGFAPRLKDFSEEDRNTIPEDFDVLLAGFPCQPFSIAGVSKKNSLGRSHGFDDPTQGTLFFNIKEILRVRRPKAFLLENVKNLRSHNRGDTFGVICDALRDIGYAFFDHVIDAASVVPQHRERIFIVGYDAERYGVTPGRKDGGRTFWADVETGLQVACRRQMERHRCMKAEEWPRVGAILQAPGDVHSKYTLTPRLWDYLQAYKKKHQAAGNGFGFGLVTPDSRWTRTISARYYKDGSEVLVDDGGIRPRRLTPLECLRLQGFPEGFEPFYNGQRKQPVSDTQAYKQFGNSVCAPVVEAIASVMARHLASDPTMAHQLLSDLPERPVRSLRRQLSLLVPVPQQQ